MSDNIIPFNKPKEPEPKCSFCGTPKSKAKSMISSSDGMRHICDRCIVKAKQRLTEAA
jgi:hypothetical protein